MIVSDLVVEVRQFWGGSLDFGVAKKEKERRCGRKSGRNNLTK